VGSTLSRNTATKGGAIFSSGELAVHNSTLSVNVARSYGGGLYKQFGHDSPSLVSVEGSTLANNSAARDGGGLYYRCSSNFSSG
jgi:predicted outer membrane repeat protein